MAIIEGDKTAEAAAAEGAGNSRRKFAVVCSSNVNRSIMAEILLKKHNMRTRSFGTGRCAFPLVFVLERCGMSDDVVGEMVSVLSAFLPQRAV